MDVVGRTYGGFTYSNGVCEDRCCTVDGKKVATGSYLWHISIDRHINNFTALSGKILDDVLNCRPYSDFSF